MFETPHLNSTTLSNTSINTTYRILHRNHRHSGLNHIHTCNEGPGQTSLSPLVRSHQTGEREGIWRLVLNALLWRTLDQCQWVLWRETLVPGKASYRLGLYKLHRVHHDRIRRFLIGICSCRWTYDPFSGLVYWGFGTRAWRSLWVPGIPVLDFVWGREGCSSWWISWCNFPSATSEILWLVAVVSTFLVYVHGTF